VNLPDGRPGQAAADTGTAPAVALVSLLRPVFDVWPAVAVRLASAQLGVERVEDGGPQGADLLLADEREDVPSGQVAVRGERRGLDLEQIEVPLEQLLDGGGGLRARFSSTWPTSRRRAFFASVAAVGPAGITSRR
jgi:hypothetical protein